MSKIGIFVHKDRYGGGTYQYCLGILGACAALAGADFEVVVACGSTEWMAHAMQYGLRSFMVEKRLSNWLLGDQLLGALWTHGWLPWSWWRKYFCHMHLTSDQLLAENCDLWIFPDPSPFASMFTGRSLITVHDLMHRYESHFPEVGEKGEYRRRERYFRNICRNAAGVLVDSECGRDHVQECYGLTDQKIFIQPFAPTVHAYDHEDQTDVVERYRLPQKFLLYPAQFWRHKNHERLLRALAHTYNRCPDVALVLCGAFRLEYKAVLQFARKHDLEHVVHFLGYVPDRDVTSLYRRARALIYPSFFGPTNIPPLEAFALGCPVAAADVYGVREQLGEAALLFDPKSESEMADAMAALWCDDGLCRQLRQCGFTRSVAWGPPEFAGRLKRNIDSALAVGAVGESHSRGVHP
jgi:glycosyltransferase involved in cell wall biosynthesis